MEKKLIYHYNKKGLSGIITAMIMIGLVLAAAGIIWAVVNGILKGSEGAESCIEAINKVTINGVYTCYDSDPDGNPATDDGEVQFSLSIGDIEVDEVLVSISSAGDTQSYILTNEDDVTVDGLGNYPTPDFGVDLIQLPGKRGGKTYVANGFSSEPDLIKIAPTIGGRSCDVSDSLSHIESCSLSG